MAKKPDFSELTKKLDVSGIVNSLKSMINPAGGTPDVDPSDAIGMKIAQVSTLVQEMAKVQAQQTKDLQKVNQLLNGLFQDLEALRHPPEQTSESKATVAQEKSEAPKPEVKAPEVKAEETKPESEGGDTTTDESERK